MWTKKDLDQKYREAQFSENADTRRRMSTYVILLRGVTPTGKNKVLMAPYARRSPRRAWIMYARTSKAAMSLRTQT